MVRARTEDPQRRLIEWGVVLAVVGLIPLRAVLGPPHGMGDWLTFYTAGKLAGTPALLQGERFLAFQRSLGYHTSIFPYPPAVAYLYAPLSRLPLLASFAVNGVVMLACAALAGTLGSRLFGIPMPLGILASLAWAPMGASVTIGQNAPLGTLLAMLAIGGLAAQRPLETAVPIGLLLYKPTYALPLIVLLALRRRWRELGIVALIAGGWYALGVAAAAGDPAWPLHYARLVAAYYPADARLNAFHAISLPVVMERLGSPPVLAFAAAAVLFAAAIPGLVRRPAVEAGAAACALGLALSPHAYTYDAALLLPLLLLGATVSEPLRTRAAFGVYVLPAVPIVSAWAGVVPAITVAAAIAWTATRSVTRR